MNISKDGKTLYFSDEEIENDQTGEKKVFVTKRINGKESHVKPKKTHKNKQQKQENYPQDTFNFNNEIVIGVNKVEEDKNKKKRTTKKKEKPNKKENQEKKQLDNRRSPNKKKRKKKGSIKKVLTIFGAILLVAVVIIFALTAPIFNITDIKVEGNSTVPKETVISLSGLKKGENIFKFNNQIVSKIKENQYVDTVKLERKLPGTVVIKIVERSIKYQINLVNSYTYIDKNGYILENSTIKKEVPTIVGLSITENELINKKRLEVGDLEKLNKISKIMDSAKAINIDNLITEINIEKEEDCCLYIESKSKKIYIGDTSNLTNKMLFIQKILEQEEGKSGTAFVNGDISAGFRPYFREE